MKYVYYVTWMNSSIGGGWGFGFGTFEQITPIMSIEDILEIRDFIASQDPEADEITITNFILLRTEE